VSARLAIVASPEDGELAGLSGGFDWGEVSTGTAEALAAVAREAAVIVTLGALEPPAGFVGRWVRWLAGSASEAPPGPARVVAQDGSGLWRRAPWPVTDLLFDLPIPPQGSGALVVSPSEERRAELVKEFSIRGLPATGRERLTVRDLRDAQAVVLLSEPGAPLPAYAMAVPAAGRVLVTWRPSPSFGLLPDIDHFDAATPVEAVQYADGVLRRPGTYERVRRFGRLAAERHRASLVYARLVADLELEEAVASGSPGGRGLARKSRRASSS
jgi:hypothetical protein